MNKNRENRDIEWLVHWAFAMQMVEAAVLVASSLAPTLAPSALLQMAALGVRVDNSSPAERLAGVRCHDDALTIYDHVCRLPTEARGLIVLHGRAGSRPDWCPEGVGKCLPVLDSKGKPKRMWRDSAKQRGDLGPMMVWEGNKPEMVEYYRDIWTVWREALSLLADAVNAEMVAYRATPPRVPSMPWDWTGSVLFEEAG